MQPTPRLFPRRAAAFLAAATLTLYSGTLAAQKKPAAAADTIPAKADAKIASHVLNRLGFGARPGDIERVQTMGVAAYIDQQLHPERIDDAELQSRLSEFETLSMSTADLADKYFMPAEQMRRQQQRLQAQNPPSDQMMAPNGQPAPPPASPELQAARQAQANVINELMQAKVLRAALSEKQLNEVLVDFWFNHFNVFVGKGQVRDYLPEYERDVIRPHVLGNFRELLGAVAHSPAMLFYLDNWQSASPNAGPILNPEMERRLNDPRVRPDQRRQMMQRLEQMRAQQKRPQRGLNENYARELMELHTLGVDGGYSQQDVIELAKILTGWTIDRPQQGGGFVFRPQMHDNGTKTLLGQQFAPNGEAEGERALDLLSRHPSTAHHIAFKLAQRFIADEPPAAVVDRAAKVFLDTKGDLREVTRTILTSPEFFAPAAYRAKVKTPFEFVVSAVRATDATVVNAQPMVVALRNLGMPVYGAQPPTGYSMTADAWVNTGALLGRMNFAVDLMNGGRVQPVEGPGRGAGRPVPPQAAPNGRPGGPPPQAGQGGQGRGGRGNALRALLRGPLQVDINTLAPDTTDASRTNLIRTMLAGDASDGTRQTLARAETPQNLVALTLGSPEFQRR